MGAVLFGLFGLAVVCALCAIVASPSRCFWQAPGLGRRLRKAGEQRPRPLSRKEKHHCEGDAVQEDSGTGCHPPLGKPITYAYQTGTPLLSLLRVGRVT
jgi:hypothetical protein